MVPVGGGSNSIITDRIIMVDVLHIEKKNSEPSFRVSTYDYYLLPVIYMYIIFKHSVGMYLFAYSQ